VVVTLGGDLRGSLDEDGQVGRHILVRATPHAATYVLLFAGWGPRDARDKTPPWKVDETIVARLVSDGDDMDLVFDGEYRPPAAVPSARCQRP
jgi:hypothetical protein